jgi:hypothetical protein
MKCTAEFKVFFKDIMMLAFLYSTQIIGQIITTGSQKVSKYHVQRKQSYIPYTKNNKDNIQVRNRYKKYCNILKIVINEA